MPAEGQAWDATMPAEGQAWDATMPGDACVQDPFGTRTLVEGLVAKAKDMLWGSLPAGQSAAVGRMGESCLNVNVWTPGLGGEKRPVMVWIHGGGNFCGSNLDAGACHGELLSRRHNVVVVSLNYRLQIFGYLHWPDAGVANLGLQDQIAGLRWVQQEIANFGACCSFTGWRWFHGLEVVSRVGRCDRALSIVWCVLCTV
jgi:acetyl esterase/lipase